MKNSVLPNFRSWGWKKISQWVAIIGAILILLANLFGTAIIKWSNIDPNFKKKIFAETKSGHLEFSYPISFKNDGSKFAYLSGADGQLLGNGRFLGNFHVDTCFLNNVLLDIEDAQLSEGKTTFCVFRFVQQEDTKIVLHSGITYTIILSIKYKSKLATITINKTVDRSFNFAVTDGQAVIIDGDNSREGGKGLEITLTDSTK
jgi:hypothetical protein